MSLSCQCTKLFPVSIWLFHMCDLIEINAFLIDFQRCRMTQTFQLTEIEIVLLFMLFHISKQQCIQCMRQRIIGENEEYTDADIVRFHIVFAR